jgi:hypothetical protein
MAWAMSWKDGFTTTASFSARFPLEAAIAMSQYNRTLSRHAANRRNAFFQMSQNIGEMLKGV